MENVVDIHSTYMYIYISFDENQQTNYRGLDRNLPQMLCYISSPYTGKPLYFVKIRKHFALHYIVRGTFMHIDTMAVKSYIY